MNSLSNVSPGPEEQYPVYMGIWTNWSRGRIMGATLTLAQPEANLLIAFTAFFIALVAARFWIILCFALHRFYSTSDAQDAVYNQRQVILRNASSPEYGLWLLLQLLWENRRSKKPFRPIFAVFLAVFCIVGFTIAGGFSSRISTAIGNEVLLKSVNCGYESRVSKTRSPYYPARPYEADVLNSAANYAQQCYYSYASSGLLDCGRFITQSIPGYINKTAACPFKDDRICRRNGSNLWLDTGYVDSHKDLGLNAPENERIFWRSVLHCAPLVTRGFTSHKLTPSGNLTTYEYGASTGQQNNITYTAESVESQVEDGLSPDMVVVTGNYRLE